MGFSSGTNTKWRFTKDIWRWLHPKNVLKKSPTRSTSYWSTKCSTLKITNYNNSSITYSEKRRKPKRKEYRIIYQNLRFHGLSNWRTKIRQTICMEAAEEGVSKIPAIREFISSSAFGLSWQSLFLLTNFVDKTERNDIHWRTLQWPRRTQVFEFQVSLFGLGI